ncbi:uncharacterized protein LOC120345690 [Styela clava]
MEIKNEQRNQHSMKQLPGYYRKHQNEVGISNDLFLEDSPTLKRNTVTAWTSKNRKLNSKNKRRVVRHLRRKLGIVREARITALKKIDEIEKAVARNESKLHGKECDHTKKKDLSLTNSIDITTMTTLGSAGRINGLIRKNGFHVKSPYTEYVFNSEVTLPSIVVDDHDASVFTESDQRSVDSRRKSTPGIFTDWKSDNETSENGYDIFQDDIDELQVSDKNDEHFGSHGDDITKTVCGGDVNSKPFSPKGKVKIYVLADESTKTERQVLLTKIFSRFSNNVRGNGFTFEIVDLCEESKRVRTVAGKKLRSYHIEDAHIASAGTAFIIFLSSDLNESLKPPVEIPQDVMRKLFGLIRLEILACEAAIHISTAEDGDPEEITNDDESVTENETPKKVRFVDDEITTLSPKKNLIKSLQKRIQKCHKFRRMINHHYELDMNSVPPTYVLTQHSSRNSVETNSYFTEYLLKYFRRLQHDPDIGSWIKQAFKIELLSEITAALKSSKNPSSNCLCFLRNEINDFGISKASKTINNLKTELRAKLGYTNVRQYKISSTEMKKFHQGRPTKLIDGNNTYLEKLEFDLYNAIYLQMKRNTELIHGKSSSVQSEIDNDGYTNAIAIEHVKFLQENCKHFVGREKILQEMRKYVISEYERVPLAICGESGCGLSSIMSMAASGTKKWIKQRSFVPDIRYRRHNRETIVIFRSVGVTSESRSVKHLLHDICLQLQHINISNTEKFVLGSVQQMGEIFKHVLASVIEEGFIVVIFIDNLNAVFEDKEKFSLSWIPKPLPKYVKIILSFNSNQSSSQTEENTTAKDNNMLKAYNNRYKKKAMTLTVSELSFRTTLAAIDLDAPTTSVSVMNAYLQQQHRTLTRKQISLILRTACICPTPLSLKLLMEATKMWRSTTTNNICAETIKGWGSNIGDFCQKFLSLLSRRHNLSFFRSAVCFLTCSRNGLTHQEIVDLISRDGKVSKEILANLEISEKAEIVPSRNQTAKLLSATENFNLTTENRCESVFTLNAMLYRVFKDLYPFIIETISDNVSTIKWRHKVFEKQVRDVFMATTEESIYYHQTMLSYFSNKPFTCQCGLIHECGQPLKWRISCRTTLNARRTSESMHHALACGNYDVIKKEMLFDMDWLQAKLDATSIETLMDEMYRVLKAIPRDNDVRLLAEALFLSHDVLSHDPKQLPSQLLGRLHDVIEKDIPSAPEDPRRYPYTRILLAQFRRRHFGFLMPTKTCLTSGKQIIYDALYGHDDVITAITSCTDGQRVVTASKDSTIKIWDVIERRVLRTIENAGKDISSMCVCMGNYYVATIHKQNQVNVWSLLKCSKVLTVKENAQDEKISLTVVSEGQLLAIVSKSLTNVRAWDLDKLDFYKEINILPEKGRCPDLSVARNSRGNNAFIGYKGQSEAVVVNVKRGKIIRTLTCEKGKITQVETSREYYIIGCRQRRMEVHEISYFYLFDSINYGLISVLRSCADDVIFDFFVNRLGSHLIGLCMNQHGTEELVVWSTNGDAHRHMVRSRERYLGGTCTDLQYCMTASETESVIRIHNLAAEISKHDHSRTQVRKKVDGIGRVFNMPQHEKYVVAQGTGGSPITIWNVARSRCRGEAVIIERGLLDKNDVVVVKDIIVVILSDRGMVTINERSQQVFETIYVYNLLLRKYERKLHPVRINMCPPDHYHVIDNDKLIATSMDRISFVVWSIITGNILYQIHSNFPAYEVKDKTKKKRPIKRSRRIGQFSEKANIEEQANKKRTTWKKCKVSEEEKQRTIFEMIVSGDDRTLICSYYSRHLAVFDLETQTHRHTLTDKHSLLQLHKSVVTPDGCFLLSLNYDDAAHSSYITLWDLKEGCVSRRRRDEPKVCSMAMTRDASRIVFVTEDNFIKIWDPLRRHSHRSIAGYPRLDVTSSESDDSQSTTIFAISGGKRAILFANSISVWDLEKESLLMVFEPDVKFQCCTVALRGQVIVVGMRDSANITTLRLPPSPEHDEINLNEKDRFGEGSESSDDSTEDEQKGDGLEFMSFTRRNAVA